MALTSAAASKSVVISVIFACSCLTITSQLESLIHIEDNGPSLILGARSLLYPLSFVSPSPSEPLQNSTYFPASAYRFKIKCVRSPPSEYQELTIFYPSRCEGGEPFIIMAAVTSGFTSSYLIVHIRADPSRCRYLITFPSRIVPGSCNACNPPPVARGS